MPGDTPEGGNSSTIYALRNIGESSLFTVYNNIKRFLEKKIFMYKISI